MGMNTFAPFLKQFNRFVVKNISDPPKTIKIFDYPIPYNMERDLLSIRGISSGEILSSLMKGTLNHKIRTNEIIIVDSDIDLLQFNMDNKSFLQQCGIVKGLQVDGSNNMFLKKEDIQLVGLIDNINTVFYIPSGYFIQNSIYKIIVYKNGVKQFLGNDFTVFEQGGPGTGYNGVLFTVAPQLIPIPSDILTADYYIFNV
jgi:hypothetical protein